MGECSPRRAPSTPLTANTMPTRLAMAFWLLLTLSLLLPGPGFAAVWPIERHWSEAEEQRYGQWLADHVDAAIFYDDSPYAPFATDCADSVYAMRMIYAYENRLPFVIADPARSGHLLSQDTARFDHLPAGRRRFRAFLEWIANLTSTSTLANDTYPIAINRAEVRPGVLFLAWHTHAIQIVGVLPTGVLRYLESTSPRAVRVLTTIHGLPLHVPADPQSRRHGDGYRRFKWPEHYGRPEAGLPGFSTEQFALARQLDRDPFAFQEWVRQRLAYTEEHPTGRAHRHMMTLCQMAWERATTIDAAQAILHDQRRRGQRCMGNTNWHAYSTPGRDRGLRRAFDGTLALMARPDWPEVSGKMRRFYTLMADALPPEQVDEVSREFLAWCDIDRVDGGPGRPMHLAELNQLSQLGSLVADPNASVAQRWGLRAYTPSCPGTDGPGHGAPRAAASTRGPYNSGQRAQTSFGGNP
jgi:hypothetical protein